MTLWDKTNCPGSCGSDVMSHDITSRFSGVLAALHTPFLLWRLWNNEDMVYRYGVLAMGRGSFHRDFRRILGFMLENWQRVSNSCELSKGTLVAKALCIVWFQWLGNELDGGIEYLFFSFLKFTSLVPLIAHYIYMQEEMTCLNWFNDT